MIFLFDINTTDLHSIKSDLLEDRLNRLLQSHRDGNLLLVFNRQNSKWIYENVNLTQQNKASLREIISKISTTNNISIDAEYKIHIVKNRVLSYGDFSEDSIEITDSNLINIIEKPILVVENLFNDGGTLKILFSELTRKYGMPHHSVELCAGNGSQVDKTRDHYRSLGRLSSSITDTDKIYPDHNLQFIENKRFSYALKIPCHEIENLFGLDALSCIGPHENPHQQTITLLNKIDTAEGECADKFFTFFDLKNGLCRDDVELLGNTESKEWLEMKLSLAVNIKDDYKIFGFGNNLCRRLLESGNSVSSLRKYIKTKSWGHVFDDFFSRIMWIYCASPVRRT